MGRKMFCPWFAAMAYPSSFLTHHSRDSSKGPGESLTWMCSELGKVHTSHTYLGLSLGQIPSSWGQRKGRRGLCHLQEEHGVADLVDLLPVLLVLAQQLRPLLQLIHDFFHVLRGDLLSLVQGSLHLIPLPLQVTDQLLEVLVHRGFLVGGVVLDGEGADRGGSRKEEKENIEISLSSLLTEGHREG